MITPSHHRHSPPQGYRVVAVGLPVVWEHEEFVSAFDSFLDNLRPPVQSAHLWGVGLGGYLAQCFACRRPRRVRSLALTSSYCSTLGSINATLGKLGVASAVLPYVPGLILTEYVVDLLLRLGPEGEEGAKTVGERVVERSAKTRAMRQIAWAALDFMEEQVDNLEQSELASRLALLYSPGMSEELLMGGATAFLTGVRATGVGSSAVATAAAAAAAAGTMDERAGITLIDSPQVNGKIVARDARKQLQTCYPKAKVAILSEQATSHGCGIFPFLTCPDEVTMHLQVHLRRNGAFPGLDLRAGGGGAEEDEEEVGEEEE